TTLDQDQQFQLMHGYHLFTCEPGLTEAEMLAAMIHSLTDVLFDMARVSNLGDCEDCVLNLGTRDVLLLPFKGGYLVALTDTKARKREIFAELWKIARAA
ncbi:MAG: hypothetical protein NT028_10310, partial [candidate division Zixibacteria bacterium]|nr:hypothetical protein [candidate division Zixibacteria bacterium]